MVVTPGWYALRGGERTTACCYPAPTTVEIPLRVAVVQGGVGEKVIATKAYRTTVTMTSEEGSEPFTLVADDMVYPVPSGNDADKYVFYIGFDPQALAPEPKAARKRK